MDTLSGGVGSHSSYETASPAPGAGEGGDDQRAAASVAEYEEAYERKRLRLAEVEEEARKIRDELARKDEEIHALREELGLTPLAQLKQAVETSAAYQKTMEIGDRVASSDAYKKTSSTLADVGNKTAELLKSASAKTSETFNQASQNIQESETLNGIGAKFRQATTKIKGSFTKDSVDEPHVSVSGLTDDPHHDI